MPLGSKRTCCHPGKTDDCHFVFLTVSWTMKRAMVDALDRSMLYTVLKKGGREKNFDSLPHYKTRSNQENGERATSHRATV